MIVYRRNFAGYWTRNGISTTRVPARVLELASYMALECTIEVPDRKRKA